MRKILLLFVCLVMVLFASCDIANTNGDTTDTEKANETSKLVTTANDSLSIVVPKNFEEQEQPTMGQIYTAYGTLEDKDGNDVDCTMYVTRFFHVEEPNLTYNLFINMPKSVAGFLFGGKAEYRLLDDKVKFGDSARGIMSKIEYTNITQYLAYIEGDGVYYCVAIVIFGEVGVKDIVPASILDTISIDTEAEKAAVAGFSMDIDGRVYTSAKMNGASITMPRDWMPAESFTLIYPGNILCITKDDNHSTICVRAVKKSQMTSPTRDTLEDILYMDMVNRGMCDPDVGGLTVVHETETQDYTFFVYTKGITITHCIMENEECFFVIEGIYSNTDPEGLGEVMDTSVSFVVP